MQCLPRSYLAQSPARARISNHYAVFHYPGLDEPELAALNLHRGSHVT
jgi:hypothetical protein